jgi:hypothetical protein
MVDLLGDRLPGAGEIEAIRPLRRGIEQLQRDHAVEAKSALAALGAGHQVPGRPLADKAQGMSDPGGRGAVSGAVAKTHLAPFDHGLLHHVEVLRAPPSDRAIVPVRAIHYHRLTGGFGRRLERLRQGPHQLAQGRPELWRRL